ncbi:DUF1829 domain-containing protein [Tindallia californiensis]|uniref:DUF1829 domain-containing protein n=1 Tax=Tindallia californiensis TaxID=159292 RepID=A0A1H3QS41_9FIRM|nr:DUF1829 domain-containing protein [Tindallia californiensis]SDZ16334.1 protein of unknown function DUF1828 [Tindallia californiensis]
MKLKPNDFVDSYINWLKSKIILKEIKGFYEITTPFLDRHNDHLQIYAKQVGEKIILTDDGYVISDLLMSGCDISSPRRQNVLHTILNSLGVRLEGDAMIVDASVDNFPQKKHLLLQAMISVNDMFMMSQTRVASLFLEDVEHFLDFNDVRYTPSVQFNGKSGFAHSFDFVIPSSKKMPERLIKAINNPSREKAQTLLFSWNDIQEVRKRKTAMFVFVNDMDKSIRSDILGAFSEYGITTIAWTKREQFLDRLIA